MRLVYEVCRAVQIPVVGLGGIETLEDALEYLIVGASAVQVGTAHFADPRASVNLIEGLEKWCLAEKLTEISQLRGTLRE